MYSRRNFVLKLIFFCSFSLSRDQAVEKLWGPNFHTPLLIWGSYPLGFPRLVRAPMSVIYQPMFIMLVSFYGFSMVLNWFIIDSNQPEVYLINFRSTESKKGIPLLSCCSPTETRTKIYNNKSQIDQHSADLCEISSAHVYWLLQYLHCTRSSADADNRLDAFSGQSRSTNMVPFHM